RTEAGVWEPAMVTEYVWDGRYLLHEVGLDRVVTWLRDGDELVGKIDGARAYAVLVDATFAPTELISDDGSLAWRGAVDLFGNVQATMRDTECPWRWAGHYEDAETGLHHTLTRVYDPETGT